MKRAGKMTRQLKTILERVVRDIERKAGRTQGQIADEPLRELVALTEHLLEQTRTSKNKVYSVHAPEVECLAKGKAHKRYEFDCKTSVATTNRSYWIVSTQTLHGNPYDGHTLCGAIAQIERLNGQAPQGCAQAVATKAILLLFCEFCVITNRRVSSAGRRTRDCGYQR